MICITDRFPAFLNTAESIKIYENMKLYGDVALIFEQKNSNLLISLLDGDMVIDGQPCDTEELKEFINLNSPKSIFANFNLIKTLDLNGDILPVSVMKTFSDKSFCKISDTVNSKEAYGLLNIKQFSLPTYENFAVDFCLRLNRGRLKYFAVKDKAIAISIGEKEILINALVSREKGYGGICLKGILSENINKNVYVLAKEDVKAFYEKYGFGEIYKAAYWRK